MLYFHSHIFFSRFTVLLSNKWKGEREGVAWMTIGVSGKVCVCDG